MYLSVGYNEETLFQLLETWIRDKIPTVIMGDVNEDLMKKKSKLKDFLSGKGFSQLIEQPTFDKGSLIDHIYVNTPMTKKTV